MRMFQHYPAALTFVIATGLASAPAPSIRVMLLDGANNHDWKATSPVIRKILDEAAIFKTTTVTVDNADQAPGRAALILGLRNLLTSPGSGGDYGVKAGASSLLPKP